MWNGVWLFVAGLVGMALAYYLFAKDARDRIISQGISLQARLRYQQASNSPWTVVENFTCGWLNLMLKYMWPGFLSNISNNIATNQLNRLFARLSRTIGSQALFRVALSELKLRELCLGSTAPRFENATVRIHPRETMMEFEVDVDWVTTGMKLIVDSLVSVAERQWNMKLIGVELILRGRMLFVLHLSQTVLPGLSGVHFTFVKKPQLAFDISLKGVMFSEVPGLVGEMKRRLLSVIMAEAVEPARVYIDLSQPFRNLFTRKQGGQRGQLKVVLLRGTDLKPACLKSAPEGARDNEACQCFVELRVLGRSYVSPIAPQGSSPDWNWTFWVPLDDLPTAADYAQLRFTAINFMARNQPQILGEGTLHVDDHKLEELTDREPLLTKVRLKSPKGSTGGGGNLHISLHYDASTAKPSSASVNPSADGSKQSAVSIADAASAAAAAAAARNTANGVTHGSDNGDRRSRPYDSAGNGAAIGAGLQPLQEVPEHGVFEMGDDDHAQTNGSKGVVDLASLSAMARSDARERERELGAGTMRDAGTPTRTDHFSMHAVTLAAAQRRIEHLERAISLETQRRHEEELRALLEGAPFVLHRGSDRAQRHVWVAEAGQEGGAMLRWQSHRGMSWQRFRAARSNVAKVQYHEAAVHLIQSVTYGHDLFPETQFQRNLGKTKTIPLPKDQCFSLLLNVCGEDSGESVTVALHLEVPPAGNGRSRNEWVSAFNSLMCKKLPIYQSTEGGDGEAADPSY